MLKPARSPVRGYNHNVKYRGRVFHVQTEESGPASPRISTHLYFGGTILASKRHEYDPAAPPEIVRALMQSQHKSILRDLKAGRNDANLLQFFAARGEELAPIAAGNGPADDEFPDEQTPAPVVTAATPVSPVSVAAAVTTPAPVTLPATPVAAPTAAAVIMPVPPPLSVPRPMSATAPLPPSVTASAAPAPATPPPVMMANRARPIVADALVAFGDNFDDEPTNPEERARHNPAANLAARAGHGTPALGSAAVRIERTVALGGKTPGPTAVPARARRPAPSFPYVVQEGSHPVQNQGEEAGQPVLTPAPLVTQVTEPMVSPVMAPPLAAAPVAVVSSGGTPVPARPATPLVPPPSEAPLTAGISAANLGATPEATVSREDNQSLDEVIMAYLARGVDSDAGNLG
jgi:hypothetical protein